MTLRAPPCVKSRAAVSSARVITVIRAGCAKRPSAVVWKDRVITDQSAWTVLRAFCVNVCPVSPIALMLSPDDSSLRFACPPDIPSTPPLTHAFTPTRFYPGLTGRFCEVNIDECLGKPCGTLSVCKDGINAYECFCAPGFIGKSSRAVFPFAYST